MVARGAPSPWSGRLTLLSPTVARSCVFVGTDDHIGPRDVFLLRKLHHSFSLEKERFAKKETKGVTSLRSTPLWKPHFGHYARNTTSVKTRAQCAPRFEVAFVGATCGRPRGAEVVAPKVVRGCALVSLGTVPNDTLLFQASDCVEHCDNHYADVGKDCKPHIGNTERAEGEADCLNAERKPDIFVYNAQAFTRNADCL